MKNFTEVLIVNHESKYSRLFTGIKIGEYTLSVQGSPSHYCFPSVTLEPNLYSNMEIALWKADEDFIDVSEDINFKSFSRLDDLMERWNDGVYGYVDVDIIQDLYEFLIELEK